METFASQIAADMSLTVTHPDVTRFFMTVQEAVELVIQAGAIGRQGEALVLDMGQPVRINDVAQQLIDLSGKDLDIEFTGMRPGEKMHEERFGAGEPDIRPRHPWVSHVQVPDIDTLDALSLDPGQERLDVVASMAKLCRAMEFGSHSRSPADTVGGR